MNGFAIAPQFNVPIIWTTVVDSVNPEWPFGRPKHLKTAKRLADRLRGPGLYQFQFYESDNCTIREIYIGEAECILARFQRYRTPKTIDVSQAASSLEAGFLRYDKNRLITKLGEAQSLVVIKLGTVEWCQLNHIELQPHELSNPFVRKFLENLAILDAAAQGIRVINRGLDTHVKDLIGRKRNRR